MHGSVGVFKGYAKQTAYRAQPVASLVGIQPARKGERVQHGRVEGYPHARALRLKHAHIKGRVMRRDRTVPNKIQKFADTLGRTLLAAQHQVRNARNLADFGFERHARVAQQA